MSDQRHRHHSHRSREGSHSSHSNGSATRPRRNYKLIADPYVDSSFSERIYRFEGAMSGHSPIPDPVDPRSRGGRFVLGAKEFPVPRFVYDKFSIGDPPRRDLFISGINDNLREDDITKMCQKIGEVHSVEVYYHPERKAHLGAATVCFLKSSVALRVMEELNGKKVMGQCLQVQVDDSGEIAADYKKSKLSATQPTLAATQSGQRRPSDPRSATAAKTVPTPLPPQPPTPSPLLPPAELLAFMKNNPFLPAILASVAAPQAQDKVSMQATEYQPSSLEERLEKLKVQGVFPVPPTLSPPPPPPPTFDPSQLLSLDSTYNFLAPPPLLLNLPPPPPPAASPPAPPPPLPKSRKKATPPPDKQKPDPPDSKDRSKTSNSLKHPTRTKRRSPTSPHSTTRRRRHTPTSRDRDRHTPTSRDRDRHTPTSRDRDRHTPTSRDRDRHTPTSRDRDRHTPTSRDRDRHTPTSRDRDRDRDRERDRERERERGRGRDRTKSRDKDRDRSRYKSREKDRGHTRGREDRDRDRYRRGSHSPSSHRQSSKRYPPMSHASFNIHPTPPLSHASILAPGHKKTHTHKRHLNHSSRHSTPSKHDTGYQPISDVSSDDEHSKSAKSHTSESVTREQPAPAGEEDMDLDTDGSESAPVIEMFQPQQQKQQLDLQQNMVIQLCLQTLINNNLQLPLAAAALAALNTSQQIQATPSYTPPSPVPPPPASPHPNTYQSLDPGELSELLQQQLPPGPVTLPGGWSRRRQLGPLYPVPKTFSDDVSNRVLFRLVQELHAVLCRDISKRLIEQTANKGMEKHWEPQDIRLDIYGPLARKGGSSSGSKSQELPSPVKSEGVSSKHRGSGGTGANVSPSRPQPHARFKIPLLARRSLSNMNRGRRQENKGGGTGGARQRVREKEERMERRRSASSNESSPGRKKERQRKPAVKRVISSSPEPESGQVLTEGEKVEVPDSAKISSTSSSSSCSSSSDYSSDSESEHTSIRASPPPSPSSPHRTGEREESLVKEDTRVTGEIQQIETLLERQIRKEEPLSPDPTPSPLPIPKQKSSPHEDSDSDLGAIFSPPPPTQTDGAYWTLSGREKAPVWFSANDPTSWNKDPAFLKKYAPALRRQQPPQTRRFPKRHPWEQIRVRDRFLEEGGFDEEDTKMLQFAYVRMKTDGSPLLRNVNYAYHPLRPDTTRHAPALEEASPHLKRKRTHRAGPQLSSREHLSGCVRTEGFYRLSLQEKLTQRGKLGNTERLRGWKENFDVIQTSRDSRATQRRLATELGWADINSDFAKNLLRTRKKMLCFAKSTIHNWGLFTLEPIAVDELVIEYIGECIRSSIGDVRERRYQEVGIGCSYMFRVDSDYIIDATKKGNLARFINHSCDPNCYAKIIPVGTEKRIAIYSKRDIEVNEEITYDYKFPLEDEKIPCYCGATTCRGSLN